MRVRATAAFLCVLGCSEPHLEFHVVQGADSPVKESLVPSVPCEDCIARSWIAHDGSHVALQIQRQPFLSVSADHLSHPEIVHSKGLYRPYCDSFSLSFRLRTSLAEMTTIAEKYGDLPTVATIGGNAVDVGRQLINGETITLSFAERRAAEKAARSLGASPTFRETDAPWREDARRQQIAALDDLLADPDALERIAAETGLEPADVKRDALVSQLLCP